jgi:Fic family protein
MKTDKLETLVNTYKLVKDGIPDLQKLTRYALTYHATAIEGCSLTKDQVHSLVESDLPARNKPFIEHQIVMNFYKALIFTLDQAKEGTLLSEALIRKIGELVVKNTSSLSVAPEHLSPTSGEYLLLRAFSNQRPPYYREQVPGLMKTLINDVNDRISAVRTFRQKSELALELHYRFASIHPFADGNGRTALLLMNYLLALFDLPIFYVLDVRSAAYFEALEEAWTNDDILVFYDFMYYQYQKFIGREVKSMEE